MKNKVFLILVLWLFSQVSLAQSECDGTMLSSELELFVSTLSASDAPTETLNLINDWVDNAIINCSETDLSTPTSLSSTDINIPVLTYSSEDLGLQPVIGPVDIPDGIYRATVKTDGFFIGKIEPVAGECLTGTLGLFNLSQGISTDGASSLVGSVECRGLIQISNTTEPWTLEFYAIDLEASELIQPSYSSDETGLYSVSNILKFEDGIYRVRVETDGFFIAAMETIAGECNSGFLGLFNLSQGQAASGAENTLQTEGCLAILTTTNVTDNWMMTFEKIE